MQKNLEAFLKCDKIQKKYFKVKKILKKLIDVDGDYKRSTEIIWKTKFPLKKKILLSLCCS